MRPVFPILGVFRLTGQPQRAGGIIVRSCKASQSPVYPTIGGGVKRCPGGEARRSCQLQDVGRRT